MKFKKEDFLDLGNGNYVLFREVIAFEILPLPFDDEYYIAIHTKHCGFFETKRFKKRIEAHKWIKENLLEKEE